MSPNSIPMEAHDEPFDDFRFAILFPRFIYGFTISTFRSSPPTPSLGRPYFKQRGAEARPQGL